jgi:prophage DNA circulation protein
MSPSPLTFFSDLFAGPKQFEGTPYTTPGKAIYQSPSGAKIPFDYEDITSSVATKSAVFELAAGDGTYVQPGRRTGGRFPMMVFFSGKDRMKKASAFLKALLEPGQGVLTHPVYGDVAVIPVGDIGRSDPFVSAGNQVVFTVDFYETTGLQIGQESNRKSMFDSLMDASAVDFSEKVALGDVVDAASFKNKVTAVTKSIKAALKRASQGVGAITQKIEDAGDSIDRGIDLLVGQPLALARQTQILIGEPRRQVSGARAKLAAYKDLAGSIFSGTTAELSSYTKDYVNSFHQDKMVASAIVANSAMLAADTDDFFTRLDYINAADDLEALLDDYQGWHDENYAAIESSDIDGATVDTGDGLSELRELAAASISDLITRSLQAKTQFKTAITSDRTPIDLCFELYGTTKHDTMDLFLYTNQVAGDEHFLIPKGREIVWYV